MPRKTEAAATTRMTLLASRKTFPGQGAETELAFDQRRAQGVQQQGATNECAENAKDKNAARRIAGEGVHRSKQSRPGDESAQQAAAESEYRQQNRPVLEHAPFFGDRQRMDQGGAEQPGDQRRILDRVPGPPAAPAKLVIGPPTAQCDADRQDCPGHIGPGARPARPGGVEAAAEQGGNGEGEHHGIAHIAHVQGGWVQNEADVLQGGVQVRAVVRRHRHHAREGIRSGEHEQDVTRAEQAENAKHAGDKFPGHTAAEHAHGQNPARQHKGPKQKTAFMPAPKRGDLVVHRQQGIRLRGDHANRKIVHHEGAGQNE